MSTGNNWIPAQLEKKIRAAAKKGKMEINDFLLNLIGVEKINPERSKQLRCAIETKQISHIQ